jgi:hypothetical protein
MRCNQDNSMTFSQTSIFTKTLRHLGATIPLAAAALVTATFPTHASLWRQAASPLPIQAAGDISNPQAFETSKRLIVAGSVNPAFRTPAAHVDVQLVGRSGQILAEEIDRLTWSHPRTAGGRHGNYRFTGGFPLDVARQAARIIVTFKSSPHSQCDTSKS